MSWSWSARQEPYTDEERRIIELFQSIPTPPRAVDEGAKVIQVLSCPDCKADYETSVKDPLDGLPDYCVCGREFGVELRRLWYPSDPSQLLERLEIHGVEMFAFAATERRRRLLRWTPHRWQIRDNQLTRRRR